MNKKIALFANGWNGENLDNFINGLNDIFDEDGIDLFVFSSYATYSQDEFTRNSENSIYGVADYSFFDAAIVYGSGMNSNGAFDEILRKCKEADIPVVVQGEEVDGLSSVTVNNYVGMRGLCDHLIEKHNVKDVVFIAGPKENADSNLRLQAVRDSLEAHGCGLDEENVCYANWEGGLVYSHIMSNYKDKKENLPDAIICANDPMALFAIMFFEMIGIKVPEDVIITGFDNLNEGRVFYPSLATVDQCYSKQGNECAKIVLDLICDKNQERKEVIPCVAVYGESCGCINSNNEEEIRKMLGHDIWVRKFDVENMQGRESHLTNCILSSDEYENIPMKMQDDFFSSMGSEGEDFHILINPGYKKLKYMDESIPNNSEPSYSVSLDVLASRTDGVVNTEKTIKTKKLFPGYKGKGKGKTYVFSPIRIGSSVIGYMVMGHTKGSFVDKKYIDFIGHINKALTQYQNNIKLARLNEKLSELMQKDSLTNVKNRVAYDNYIARMDNVIAMGIENQVAVVMCDINNLKVINDNLGHDAGDVYIKNCCNLMCGIFKHSPIFRTGGDEFVIIISTADFAVRHERLEELRNKMEEIASSKTSPLMNLSIATGISDFDPQKDKSILDAVKRADALMYVNKAEMKAKLLM